MTDNARPFVAVVTGGKGGVGKSTVAAELARCLAQRLRVGVLDADVNQPAIPLLLGCTPRPPRVRNGVIAPPIADQVRVMSIGLLATTPETVLSFHGPLLRGVLTQFLHHVDWGSLDVLIVDCPPGTPEAHLAVLDLFPDSHAVVVTMPGRLELQAARRCQAWLNEAGVPILVTILNVVHSGSHGRRSIAVPSVLRRSGPVVVLPSVSDVRFHSAIEKIVGYLDAASTGRLSSCTE